MDHEIQLRAIKTWTHSFEVAKSSTDRWYTKIKYNKHGLSHKTMYFGYDKMINSTYRLLSQRTWEFIQDTA